jgi:DNA end-binding protein Ku
MAARAIGSGTISFGLVSIPIKVYTAASARSVSFNMLHAKCKGRLKQQYICPTCNGEIVDRANTIKGYEYARDQYVTFAEDELKKLESAKTDELELVEFVPAETVDFVQIEKTYYLGPDKGGDRAYRLLSEAMDRTDKIAVGRYWTRGKQELVLVRPYKKGLALHYVYYADEVRSFDDVETGGAFTFKDVEVELADKLIEQLAQDKFESEKFRDEYADRVRGAVEQKVAGQEVSLAPEEPKAQIIDLLEALKKSVSLAKTKAPEAPPAAEEEQAPASARPPKKASPRKSAEKKSSTG